MGAFNINEPIYLELCHEFYSTYEFDKFDFVGVCSKIGTISFWELEEEVFDVYFQGGLRSDEHFNAQEYWLSISREENLSLSRSHTATIRNPVLRVLHKMITYGLYQKKTRYHKIQKNDLWLLSMFDARYQNGYANVAWLIMRWMKRKGVGTQRESLICCGYFITKLARKARVLSDEDVLRVAILRPPRSSMQDLYDRMGSMEIRQGAIERMAYRQSYQWDRYAGVFEHMAEVYNVPLQGAYNPPRYAQS
ncbi:retrotransposon ORF1 [Tanacetum coccineum]